LDDRFRMRMGLDSFKKWRSRPCVLGVRVKVLEPDPPVERKFGKRD
jgi:hypothetical protein